MMRALSKASILVALFVFGCSHAQNAYDFNPDDRADRAILFGFVKVIRNKADVTGDAVLTLETGQSIELQNDGFVAFHVYPGQTSFESVKLKESNVEYNFQGLRLKSGYAGTKTYFGHVTLTIINPPAYTDEFSEKWSWKAENRWKEAWHKWNATFGADRRKFFAGLPERIGSNKMQTRGIATDRQAISTGF